MPCKYVIGCGPELVRAVAAWRAVAPALDVTMLEVDLAGGEAGIAALLENIGGGDTTAFVAVDARYLNFLRLDIMGSLRLRGIAMPALVELGAVVGAGARIEDNCWIGAGAIIQPGSRIGFNSVVGAGAIVGSGATIGHSSWIDDGVVLGRDARIGSQVTLGLGVIVGHGRKIGKQCIIDKAGRIEADVAAKTFIHATHAQPLVIIGA